MLLSHRCRRQDLKDKAREYVAKLAAQGKPNVSVNGNGISFSFAPGSHGPSTAATAALLAWFDPDAMVKRLAEEIDALPEPKLALPAQEKADRITTLKAKIEKAERAEESIIEELHEDFLPVPRRRDADPAAVLGIRPKRRVAKAA